MTPARAAEVLELLERKEAAFGMKVVSQSLWQELVDAGLQGEKSCHLNWYGLRQLAMESGRQVRASELRVGMALGVFWGNGWAAVDLLAREENGDVVVWADEQRSVVPPDHLFWVKP